MFSSSRQYCPVATTGKRLWVKPEAPTNILTQENLKVNLTAKIFSVMINEKFGGKMIKLTNGNNAIYVNPRLVALVKRYSEQYTEMWIIGGKYPEYVEETPETVLELIKQ